MFIQLQQRLVLWGIRRGEVNLSGVYTATTKVSSKIQCPKNKEEKDKAWLI